MKVLKTFEDFAVFFEKAKNNYEEFYNNKATKYRVFFPSDAKTIDRIIVITLSNENETEVINHFLKNEYYTKEKNELCRLLFFEEFYRDFEPWECYPIDKFYDHFKEVNTDMGIYFDVDLGLTEAENHLLSRRLFSRVNEFKNFRKLNPTKKNETIWVEWLEKEKEFFSKLKDENNFIIRPEQQNNIINAIEKLKKFIIEREKKMYTYNEIKFETLEELEEYLKQNIKNVDEINDILGQYETH